MDKQVRHLRPLDTVYVLDDDYSIRELKVYAIIHNVYNPSIYIKMYSESNVLYESVDCKSDYTYIKTSACGRKIFFDKAVLAANIMQNVKDEIEIVRVRMQNLRDIYTDMIDSVNSYHGYEESFKPVDTRVLESITES